MSSGFSRFDILSSLLAGTATVAVLISSQAAVAKTGKEIARIARPVTVQINDSALSGGSGVIIAKEGNTYTVLTANHVVKTPDLTYTIRTDTGKNYPVSRVQRLQQSENAPDLAVVTFDSPEKYPIATLGNSEQAAIGVDVYVSGYPALGGRLGAERDYEFSPGIVTSRLASRPQGYTMRYSAVTVGGMSGGPVFDASGRVIGIHGQGESQGSVQGELGETIAIKTGFNSAIPINTFVALRTQTELSSSNVQVNNTSVSNTQQAELSRPTNARDYYVRGLSRLDSGNRQGAVEDFNQALRLNPNEAPVYYNRGNIRNRLGDKQGAIADYTQAIQQNPNFGPAYYNRGNILSRLGDKRKAISDYTQAIRLSPDDASSYYNRAVARYDRGDKQGAIEDYTQAIRFSPNPFAYNNLGKARYDLGDKQGAIKDYTQAIRLSPKFALAYYNLGKTRYDLGDKQGAIKDYDLAIRFYPNYASAYYDRGVVRYALGDKQGAIKDYTQAIQLNRNYTVAYYDRGVVRYDLGDRQGALKDLQQAANFYQQQGNTAKYQNVLTKIRELQN